MVQKLTCLFIVWLAITSAVSGQDAVASKQPAADAPHEDLDAVLWMQTSSEYYALCQQTFRAARAAVETGLQDPDWTASLEQVDLFRDHPDLLADLPPAIIVDVDETVLDNSAYQARLIQEGKEFDPETWALFVNEARSPGLPGARDLMKACREAGVVVLFVTNREHRLETATRRNLIEQGLMERVDPDVIFTKYEEAEWTSDKETRRSHLARQYRILVMMGDDLNDFVSTGRYPKPADRHRFAKAARDLWGERWFMLPNANYGGWERSLYQWQDAMPHKEKLRNKRDQMRDDRPLKNK